MDRLAVKNKLMVRIDGKSISSERLAKALLEQEMNLGTTAQDFLKSLREHVDRIIAIESHGAEEYPRWEC